MTEQEMKRVTGMDAETLNIIKLYSDHPYVKCVTVEGNIFYTKEFYMLMADKMELEGMTAVEAYQSLGFDLDILSEARANSAGTRALQKRHKVKLFENNPAEFNANTTFEEMVSKCARGDMTREELYANMASRLILLESQKEELKKKVITPGETIYINDPDESATAEACHRMENFINSFLPDALHMNLQDGMKIFGIPKSTYYGWCNRQEANEQKEAEKKKKRQEIKELICKITKEQNHVRGYRFYYTVIKRDYRTDVSEELIRDILAEMSLENTAPKFKKSKKKTERRCHPCDAVENRVNQNFFIAPRSVILTDITYLWDNLFTRKLYLCTFYDCYTKEVLGWSVRRDMSVAIVQEAYDMMMKNHGDELKSPDVLIHSDQGSVYTSTTFRQLLNNDHFVQSMSERGNSQDNSPCESWFGRMKERILNIIALAQNFGQAQTMIDNYIEKYNNTYQYYLAGLSPREFYLYKMTNVYPCPEYFGVSADDLHSIKELVDKRVDAQRKRNQQQRENYAKQKEKEQKELKKTPKEVVEDDLAALEKMISKEKKTQSKAKEKEDKLENIKIKAEMALEFIKNASEELLKLLKNPFEWKKFPELSYVHEMNGMF